MNYKPDESTWMAYLYDELEGEEKIRVENYLQENPLALKEFQSLQQLRSMLSAVKDKEVIAPPIVFEGSKQRFFWNAPYFKTIASIAASLLILMLAGKFSDLQMGYSNNEFRLSFGSVKENSVQEPSTLSAEQVQQMINASLQNNNEVVQTSLSESQKRLNESIKQNLALNSSKINQLVKQASQASKDDIRSYVASLQNENQEAVKNYFQLTSNEQQKYMEGLLVDFSKYLQQQRNNDLNTLQTRLSSIEQNTTAFKQETEQILASIISSNTANNPTKSY